MSWPKRLPDEVYVAVIGEAEAYLREHLPKAGPSVMTRLRVRLQILQAETEAQQASPEPMGPPPEIREERYRKLVARAERGDKLADTDLRVMAILYLESAIAGRGDAAAPRALLHYACNILMQSLPRDEDYLRARQVQIAAAVDTVMQKLPDISATRNKGNQTPEHPESACSIVSAALVKAGHPMSENNVQVAWKVHGVYRELIKEWKSRTIANS